MTGDPAAEEFRPGRWMIPGAFVLGALSVLPSGYILGLTGREICVNTPSPDAWISIHWLASRVFDGVPRIGWPPLWVVFFACTGWSLVPAILSMMLISASRRPRSSLAGSARRLAILGLVLSGLSLVELGTLGALKFL